MLPSDIPYRSIVCMYVYMYIYVCVKNVCMYDVFIMVTIRCNEGSYKHTNMYIHVRTYVCMYVCMFIYMYVCMLGEACIYGLQV